ncbi:unnamed protein product [Porites evermanni]|uniref:Uncharacterized protein n=1 Tax=Porites evermanni TaxID=104178 RepID=A0ABN8LE71_9CNID|nr:unnamed protein product [Porites evermanni]
MNLLDFRMYSTKLALTSFLITDEILKRLVCTVKKQLSPTKYNPLCQKMAAFWRSSMPVYIKFPFAGCNCTVLNWIPM